MTLDTAKHDIDSSAQALEYPLEVLAHAFLLNYPNDAARKVELLPPVDAAKFLIDQPAHLRKRIWLSLAPVAACPILLFLGKDVATELLLVLEIGPCASLLSRLEPEQCKQFLGYLGSDYSRELAELMSYPLSSAGYIMETRTLALNYSTTAGDAITQLKQYPLITRRRVYVIDDDMHLLGQISLERLVTARHDQTLDALSLPIKVSVSALDSKDEVAERLESNAIEMLPVIDAQNRLLGVIRGRNAIDVLKEDIASDLQSMVGVSRDEQALSTSFFAVRKRQHWLQINLLTGFLAAAVVGLFEGTIAQFTALAILMPVAAGQSGNTGAQALAVTMRGLTLREITVRDWYRVMLKEGFAGLINGVAIALTCGAGVYVWSRSLGLASVMALAMIISMTIAGVAGALVPICLKKLGQDPAQSSSIILTTVTDIAGFMSFLGIATVFSRFL